ncbi:MAG TPA: dienelactone hydrolase family protein, partial [Candidatus Acidoferrales bacterium]|nr:dienelactone hydrolase family protein [Candidatus Acidoferrales bacterium]
ATPKKQGRYPGVLVVHENRGLVEHIKDVVRRLATAGIVGLSIDLLSRQGGADKLSDPAAYAAALAKQPVASMITDLTATLVYLGRQSSVNRQALGTVGFCFGGGIVWNLVASDLPVKAAVPFYGPPPSDPGRLATTHVNVLAIYAELDTRITSSSGQVDEQLAKAGVAHKVTIYPGVNHAFHNDTGSRYAPVQAQQAWVATIEWFRKYLV